MLACRSMCLNEAHSFISSYDPTKIYVFNKKQLTHRQLLLCVQNDQRTLSPLVFCGFMIFASFF
jgi:hypothetical protein